MANETKPASPNPTPPPASAPRTPPPAKATPPRDTRQANANHAHRLHEERVKEMEVALENEKKKLNAEENLDVSALTGDLGQGEKGWILLGPDGQPTGAATVEMPPIQEGSFAAPVRGYFPVEMDTLVTPSGAPITAFMNPMPDPRDPGMEARVADGYASDYSNPQSEAWQMGKPGTAKPANPASAQPKPAPGV